MPLAMKKVGIGVIGCGGISTEHLKSYALFPEICEIVAVSDSILERAEVRKREFNVPSAYRNYIELLKDDRVDAVSICTPHNLHAPIAVEATEAGKHVLVEKPMAISFDKAKEMIGAAKRSGVKLSVIFQNRFSPDNKFMKEKVTPNWGRPIFGYVTTFHFRDSAYYASGPWRGKWAGEGGGVFINQAVHAWDIM
jgi:predicted dehydrogenase